MKYIIFDFNGTILDDVDVCIASENETIKKFNLDRTPLSRDEYLHLFTFPVKDYYTKVGFDWNKYTYEEVGDYWFNQYRSRRNDYKIFDGVIETLIKSRELGNKNILLSASSLEPLKEQLQELGISEYFDEVLGIDNIYAGSKVDIALKWISDKNPKDCLMIGDSLHDKEVADAMGVRCVLVSKGHQAKDVLLKETNDVVDDIRKVII